MVVLGLGAKAAVAVLLLVAGGAKLADLSGFASAIRLFLPAAAPRPVLAALPAASGGLALAGLLTRAASPWSPTARRLNMLGVSPARRVLAPPPVGAPGVPPAQCPAL